MSQLSVAAELAQLRPTVAAGAAASRAPRRRPIAAAWPARTTRTSRLPVGCLPRRCGRTSTRSTPTAAGPTTWPTKRPTRQRAWHCSTGGSSSSTLCYAGRRRIRCSSPCGRRSTSSRFRASRSRDCWWPFGRTSASRATRRHDEVLDYCRYSANPVGRLVLYLGRCHDAARAAAVRFDLHGPATGQLLPGRGPRLGQRARVPAASHARERRLRRSDVRASASSTTPSARRCAIEVDRAESYLRGGEPLVELVPRELRLEVALFVGGGLAILQAIRRADYDVWRRRPTVSRCAQARPARAWLVAHASPVAGRRPYDERRT